MTAIEEAREALARFDRGWRSTDELARALRALVAEREVERLPVPPSGEAVEAAFRARLTADCGGRAAMRAALEAAERVRSAVPSTTEPTEQEQER